jgi:hypothetical protein
MIGYNRLGINGRLGNQMFQYASLRGIASKHGYTWRIPPKNRETNNMAEYVLMDGFKLPHLKENNIGFVPQSFPIYDEPCHDFDETLFNNCPDNVNIDGFRQSEKYFNHIEKEIREDYEFIDDIYFPCKEFINQFNDNVIFLHVRRSDATGRPHQYLVAGIDWYKKILEENFPDDVPVLVFTDQLDWVENQQLFKEERFFISEQREYSTKPVWNGRGKLEYSLSPWIDLCLMSLCNGSIFPNSTFGWWGSWLQKNKKYATVYQHPYFGPFFTDKHDCYKDLKDLYPNDWIRGHLPEKFIDTEYTTFENEL